MFEVVESGVALRHGCAPPVSHPMAVSVTPGSLGVSGVWVPVFYSIRQSILYIYIGSTSFQCALKHLYLVISLAAATGILLDFNMGK